MNKKQRVVLYLRLSDEDKNKLSQEELSESIKNQEIMLKDYAKEQNWKIVGIYNDEDWSGSDATRPEFNNMINNCKNGLVDIVLCKTQARFARDMELIEKYVHNLFHEWNIRFITVIDKIDNTIKETKKTSQILGLTDQWYLEDTSLNIRETLKAKRKNGELTASFATYGYMKDPENKNHLIVDKVAAGIVKRIYDEYLSGYGLEKIAKNLNNDKILSPYEYKLLNGCKLKIPVVKNYLNYNYIEKTGTYIINTNFINKEDYIINNLIVFNYITNFNNKCDIILRKYNNKIKIYYTDKNNININNFNLNECTLLNKNNYIPKTATTIIIYVPILDRTHFINYQLEVILKENRKHEKYFFKTKNNYLNKLKKSEFIYNIRKKFKWSSQTIRKILTDEVYIGNMVQFKSTTVSYKNHTLILNNNNNRIRKNNTHEKIISEDIWYLVQDRLKIKNRSCKSGKIHVLCNKVYCANCNQIFNKSGNNSHGFGYLCCKDKINKWTNCDNNISIREDELHNFILDKINIMINKFYDKNIISKIANESTTKDMYEDKIKLLEEELEFFNNELNTKNIYFQRLYEDHVKNIILEKDFINLISKYKSDTEKIEERLKILKKEITNISAKKKVKKENNILKKHTKVLSFEIVEEFIEKIIIGKYDENSNSRDIKIIWNYNI